MNQTDHDEAQPAPAALLFCAFSLGLCAACLQNLRVAGAALALGVALVLLRRPPGAVFLRRLAAVNLFLLMLWLIVPLTSGGEPCAQWGVFRFSLEGARMAALATLKANAVYCIFAAFCGRMTPTELACAMQKLHAPKSLTLLLLFLGRSFHILSREWNALFQAARLRCFEPRFGLHAWRTLGCLLAVLLLRAHERAARMHEAMLLRGYDGEIPFRCPRKFNGRDAGLILACFLGIAGLCLLEWETPNAF